MTLVDVTILNWNGGPLLARAVRSVLGQTHRDLQLTVVDNGSADGALHGLPTDSRLTVIENGQNLGYARGMNVGFEASRGEVWVPMNNDAILHPRFLERALQQLDAHRDAAAVAPLVLRARPGDASPWDQPDRVPVASGAESVTMDMRVFTRGDPAEPRVAFKPGGACPVYRRRALEDVAALAGRGPFDPTFDTYGEDVDLAFRLWSLGWTTWYSPDVLAAHVVGASSGERIFAKNRRLRRNVIAGRHINAWRHLGLMRLAVSIPLIVIGDIAFVLVAAAHRDLTGLSDLGTAWGRVLRNLRRVRIERQRFPPRSHADGWNGLHVVRKDLWTNGDLHCGSATDD